MYDNNRDGERDIIDAIDEAVEPGPDAMRWTAERDTDAAPPNAVLLDVDGATPVMLDFTEGRTEIATRLGARLIKSLRPGGNVALWTGDDPDAGTHYNDTAARLYVDVLRAVGSGDYAASDADQLTARRVLADRPPHPMLTGRCLLTGLDASGQPAPIGEAFYGWFHRYVEDLQRSLLNDILADLGLPADSVAQVIIIGDDSASTPGRQAPRTATLRWETTEVYETEIDLDAQGIEYGGLTTGVASAELDRLLASLEEVGPLIDSKNRQITVVTHHE